MTTFGFEFEVAENGLAVLHQLHRVGAVPNDYLCPYHGCGDYCCEHDDIDHLFSAQEDCTVSAEFPSKVLEWGTPRAESAFTTMERANVLAGSYLGGDSGMHVHVEQLGAGGRYNADILSERERNNWRLNRIFLRYQDQLTDIASGWRQGIRGYNSPMSLGRYGNGGEAARDLFWNAPLTGELPTYTTSRGERTVRSATELVGGSYLSERSHTNEFRLWNASKAAWRMRLCVAFSVAMTEAAAAGVLVTEHDPRPVEDVLAPWLDDETWTGILRQRYAQGGLEMAA